MFHIAALFMCTFTFFRALVIIRLDKCRDDMERKYGQVYIAFGG